MTAQVGEAPGIFRRGWLYPLFNRPKRGAMGQVRPLQPRDIGHLVALHHRVVGDTRKTPSRASRADFERIFLEHPWRDETLPSLVYEDDAGRVVGCLGVMPRPMWFEGRRITAAISHNFIVEPGSRSTLAGMQLAMEFLSGPQDLSIAEGSNVSRRIWERAGGETSLLYSLCWTRPLSPSRYVLSFLRNRGLPPLAATVLQPFCRLMDAVAPLVPQKPFRITEPQASGETLEGPPMAECITEFSEARSLRPSYDARSADWLLQTLERKASRGNFHKVAVRNGAGERIGWYVYIINSGGMAEVAQIGAEGEGIGLVLDHLFYHAKKNGVVAVTGGMDPALFQALSGKYCLFHHDGGSWMLIHSRHPEVLGAIHSGDACLTRLDGEWWISAFLG